jgi:hypothetical protein
MAQFSAAYGRLNREWGSFELRGNEGFTINVDISVIRALRLPRSGTLGVYEPPIELDKLQRIGIWLSVLITIREKTVREYPDILEWDTQFLMEGRPGSNRRH